MELINRDKIIVILSESDEELRSSQRVQRQILVDLHVWTEKQEDVAFDLFSSSRLRPTVTRHVVSLSLCPETAEGRPIPPVT